MYEVQSFSCYLESVTATPLCFPTENITYHGSELAMTQINSKYVERGTKFILKAGTKTINCNDKSLHPMTHRA